MPTIPFAVVPGEVCADERLSKIQLRVLIAILTFHNKATGLAYPKRSALAARCGYSERVISRATTALSELGWLVKKGNGGFGKPCVYRVTIPQYLTETVSESDTVIKDETVSESVLKTVSESVPKRFPNQTPTKNRPRTNKRTYQLARMARRENSSSLSEGIVNRMTDRSWACDSIFAFDGDTIDVKS